MDQSQLSRAPPECTSAQGHLQQTTEYALPMGSFALCCYDELEHAVASLTRLSCAMPHLISYGLKISRPALSWCPHVQLSTRPRMVQTQWNDGNVVAQAEHQPISTAWQLSILNV